MNRISATIDGTGVSRLASRCSRPSAGGVASRARCRDRCDARRRHAAKPVRIAYLSFAVANSYDAPMLAAAKAAAKKGGAKITVFDANNDPKAQFAQLQTAGHVHQYDAIIVQPIFGTGLISAVKQAIKSARQGRQHGPGARAEPRRPPGRR